MKGKGRREEILEAILAMTAEHGPDRVTTRALAARLGVTEPALYRHFPGGKSEMWRALAMLLGERMQQAWRAALAEAGGGATARVRALARAQLRTIQDNPALPTILFSRTLHRDNAALRAGVGEMVGRFHARLDQLIGDGVGRGELRADVDADTAAWLLIAVIQGTAVRWSLAERGFNLEREGCRLLDLMLAGFQAYRGRHTG
ncbi:MAG TPA: TetR family transcriptional regulator [Arenicellales bacterium]|nr:TetR family transcriptional regulator [Arenicellales bacterium]